jgi:hypothetical protein
METMMRGWRFAFSIDIPVLLPAGCQEKQLELAQGGMQKPREAGAKLHFAETFLEAGPQTLGNAFDSDGDARFIGGMKNLQEFRIVGDGVDALALEADAREKSGKLVEEILEPAVHIEIKTVQVDPVESHRRLHRERGG